MAGSPIQRDHWQGKTVKVKGRFGGQGDRIFTLVRFRRNCCAADAIRIDLPVVAQQSITHVAHDEWVSATGRVEFRRIGGTIMTCLLVGNRAAIVPSTPSLDEYDGE